VYKEVPKIVEKQVALEGVLEGDVTVKGNLIVEGSLTVTGEVSCYKIKGI
jgi:cytoskeletal protein CcmA (bactofilin family)